MRSAAVVWAVCRRTWIKTLRRPVVLTFSLGQPLVWMLLFGFLFERFHVGEPGDGSSYLDFLAPGVGAMTVLFGASQSGDRLDPRPADRLPAALAAGAGQPPPAAARQAAGGRRCASSCRPVLVLGLALLLGARLHPRWRRCPRRCSAWRSSPPRWAASPPPSRCGRGRQEAMATFVHLVNMPLLFTSTALVPHRQMPDWLAAVARINPLTLAVEAWRGALLGGPAPAAARSLLPLLALAAVTYALAARELRRCATLY